jgi:two-component system phosphate regulon response regulator PhoB
MNHQGAAISSPETGPRTSSEREPILVVEADAELGRMLVEQLAADGHPTRLARTVEHAGVLAGVLPPRLVVLGGLDSPRGNLDLLEAIRGGDLGSHGQTASPWPSSLPVIVLSSRTEQPDLLRAFEAGADDFLSRPVGYLELRARLRAVLRRSVSDQRGTPIQVGPLAIDKASHAASLHGNRLDLRRLEYALLLHLAADPRRVFSKHELLQAVWGYRAPGTTRTLDSHASRLRRKLGAAGERWVINVWGVGYRLI